MGWTYTNRPRGLTHDEFFTRKFNSVDILASATVRSTYYAAVRQRATGKVFALVCLLNWRPRDRYNFGYKDMDETMGPCEAAAPAKVLDALTDPPANDHARAWRERCAQNVTRPVIRFGDTVRLASPVTFSFGQESVFTRVRYGRARNVYQTPDGRLVRLRNVQHVPFTKEARP